MLMIIGSGRSGTTWLGKLFDSHPDTVYLHEPDAVKRRHDLPKFPCEGEVEYYAEAAADYLEELKFTRTPGVIGVPPFFPKNYRGLLGGALHKTARVTSKALRKAAGRNWAGLPVPIAPRRGAKGLYVLKSVSAVCRAPLWAAADPNLKIIHLIRHVGGRIASLERGMSAGLMNPDPQIDELFELPESELYPFTKKDILSRRFMDRIAYSWMVQNDKAAADMAGNDRYVPLLYEDLCRAPADKMARLFAYTGLETSVQTMLFLKQLQRQSAQDNARYHSVLKSPLGSIDRWRRELSLDEQDTIMDIVRHARTEPVRKALGLEPPKAEAGAFQSQLR
ncbi:sulfotransferase [Parvularcula marina]|uniref:Sulfotransferase n=1 Tax=Parvularcula marina TaxID=2292771 RepID=A0A371R8C9_9PROT|nr:sulfotransferase [Parvularcula marina]RFB01710.1 hypothetical protein DX908_15695 [Parvularcula marina]